MTRREIFEAAVQAFAIGASVRCDWFSTTPARGIDKIMAFRPVTTQVKARVIEPGLRDLWQITFRFSDRSEVSVSTKRASLKDAMPLLGKGISEVVATVGEWIA